MSKKPAMLSLEEARSILLSGVSTELESELESLANLPGRILAEDIDSPINVPPADNSAMDGYALRHADIKDDASFRLIGKSMAGKPFDGVISAGQCVRITTGAFLPPGADTVEMQENVALDESGESVLIRLLEDPPNRGANVRYQGEGIAIGDRALNAGCRIGAIELGVLATLGFAQVKVRKRLRVALFVSGDELRAPGELLAPGDIYESNRHVLRVMLQKLGVEVIDLGVVRDDPQHLRQACLDGNHRADVVLSCGGASVGEADYAREVLEELGTLDFWKVAIKPGKPFMYGHLKDSRFFGLPGNPVSALVTFHQLVVPVLRKLQGENAPEPLRLEASITQSVRPNRNRLEFMRACYRAGEQGEGFEVTPDRQQSSGAFGALARCNCFILVPPGSEDFPAGTTLTVLPFDELLGAC